MLGCIQPMSSPMMNRMLGFFSCWQTAVPPVGFFSANRRGLLLLRTRRAACHRGNECGAKQRRACGASFHPCSPLIHRLFSLLSVSLFFPASYCKDSIGSLHAEGPDGDSPTLRSEKDPTLVTRCLRLVPGRNRRGMPIWASEASATPLVSTRNRHRSTRGRASFRGSRAVLESAAAPLLTTRGSELRRPESRDRA